ncbi:hypothetical protein [Microscilla marina]|uniref:Uncharacterized protein n=1 Tax=Microscilla marina ATCC 23134 TaxID=313606 RepID=A1ZHL5_MICM2|nr:hypothetical protein [Microscilla marina]EAY30022.1 hypothetical protein M23134_05355 [Microscilla marina ATCC 23134]
MEELMNTTNFTEEEVEKMIIEQFDIEGFIITQISDRHYYHRDLPKGIQLLDIQIGFTLPSKRKGVKYRVKNIRNLTLIVREEQH